MTQKNRNKIRAKKKGTNDNKKPNRKRRKGNKTLSQNAKMSGKKT
jgi:hypothetical protein